ETMAPADYHVICTTSLGRGSGQESPGFAKLLDVGRRLWPPFEELLGRGGASLIEIERTPRRHADLFRLVQAMMDYDEAFLNWRFAHMRLAFRVIGSKGLSLEGTLLERSSCLATGDGDARAVVPAAVGHHQRAHVGAQTELLSLVSKCPRRVSKVVLKLSVSNVRI